MNSWAVFDLNKCAKVFIIVILVASSAISGCARQIVKMYPGDKVEDSKQAVIRRDLPEYSIIIIKEIDGELIGNLFSLTPDEVYVLPGKHRLYLTVDYMGFFYANSRLWLIAEPGGKYVIRAVTVDRRVSIWIENEHTGKPVGGIVGSDDEPR